MTVQMSGAAARSRRRLVSILMGLALALTATLSAGPVFGAPASDGTFNPFDLNQGFTIVSQGDAILSNGELEGSIAAFGKISTTKDNYPVVHATGSGRPEYTVPRIDDLPVRVLAEKFVGNGLINVENRDDHDYIQSDSDEATAKIKLVNVDNLTQDPHHDTFVRLVNESTGRIELKAAAPSSAFEAGDFQTTQSSVESYFPNLEGRVSATNQCLASMYGLPDDQIRQVTESRGASDMFFPDNFADDRPNYIDYEGLLYTDWSGNVGVKTIKLDHASGYYPTADAPLVIRVPADTTSLGAINFEGWRAGSGEQQHYARHILLDLSEVTGTVTIDGLTMGSLWAPGVNLEFNSGVTTNGQWFAQQVSTNGGGEIHHHTFTASLPCGTPAPEPEPWIGTTVAVDGPDDKVLPLTGGIVIDTVAYENLTPGVEYVLEGQVRKAGSGEDTGIRAQATFTPTSADGTTTVTFTITAEQVAAYAGQDLVVYEYLYLDDELVAEHADPDDQAQTFTVAGQVITVIKQGVNCDVDKPVCDLPGASFALYDKDPSDDGAVVIQELAVDDSGARFTSDELALGTYWLVETRAPAGFTLLPSAVQFELSTGATPITLVGDYASMVVVDTQADASGLTVRVSDTTAAPLPDTGGAGFVPYALAGALLLTAAGLHHMTSGRRMTPRRVHP